jgi:predicted DsbA family dithiol-disulfide isomerase
MIPLDIFSDPVCPWCHIGKAHLDRAVAAAGGSPFAMRWRMFRLNPDMPPDGMDRRAYLEAKFGGPEGAAQVLDRIAEAGRAAGLSMRLDEIPRTPATLDAHRLIHWAAAADAQEAVADALFRAYFERLEDISDHAVLAGVAEAAGLERPVVERLLAGDADLETLEEEEAAAREMGITGVPCFIIQGRFVLEGAQPAETWQKVIAEIAGALRAEENGEPGENR